MTGPDAGVGSVLRERQGLAGCLFIMTMAKLKYLGYTGKEDICAPEDVPEGVFLSSDV